jgi:nicotinate-nucleotide pyrophosphorylase (carboxylating)
MTKININTDFSLNVLRDVVKKNVKAALEEDIGEGDITASLISEQNNSHATVIDGDRIKENDIICELQGSTQAILTGERTALNFLQTLSGTATKTRAFVNALGCSNTKILDTRKTLPGLRLAQKYAVLCGGGNNHRIGLYDAILIKENHILACGSILKAVIKAKYDNPSMRVEVEVENLEELQQAVDAKAHMVLLDNFSLEKVKKAIKIVNNSLVIELSGGMDLDKVIMLKDLGADFISIGALTKDLHATDFSMRLS